MRGAWLWAVNAQTKHVEDSHTHVEPARSPDA